MSQENLKTKKLQFAGLYILSIILIAVIISAFLHTPMPAPEIKESTIVSSPLSADDSIQKAYNQLLFGLQKVQELDKEYIAAIKDPSIVISKDKIANAENTYLRALENINRILPKYNATERTKIKNMVSYFDVGYQQHAMISNMYFDTLSNPLKINADNKPQPDLQNAIQVKDMEIADLKRKLSAGTGSLTKDDQKDVIEDLKKSNERLKAAIAALENKNRALIRSEKNLQKNMEVLMSQLRARQK